MLSRFPFTLAFIALLGSANASPKNLLKKPDSWFAGDDAKQAAAHILSYQSDLGGWPKNVDTSAKPYSGDRSKLQATYDNGATTDELRFLARIHNATKDDAYRAAFQRGLNYILDGQYHNGGWPQRVPPGNGYHRHITFNDGAMVRLLEFAREVATSPTYRFLPPAQRQSAATALHRGISCILKCQIRINGTLTVWCAQHDEIDFRPRIARSYELASLSGAESVGITQFLMTVENPSPEIITSVNAAVAWFQKAQLKGIRLTSVKDNKAPKGTNRIIVPDPAAPPLWARFYDLKSQTPIFVDRDGIPKQALADIGYERRNGYAWYGTWPKNLLNGEHQKWKSHLPAKPTN
ncbi:MAG: pectate lyase [Verrucomicrobiaceae bacterium]